MDGTQLTLSPSVLHSVDYLPSPALFSAPVSLLLDSASFTSHKTNLLAIGLQFFRLYQAASITAYSSSLRDRTPRHGSTILPPPLRIQDGPDRQPARKMIPGWN